MLSASHTGSVAEAKDGDPSLMVLNRFRIAGSAFSIPGSWERLLRLQPETANGRTSGSVAISEVQIVKCRQCGGTVWRLEKG